MYPRTGIVFALLLALSTGACASNLDKAFDGYVTRVTSQDQFQIGSRQVRANSKTSRQSAPNDGKTDAYVDPVVRVGSRLHIEGSFDKRTREFVASSIAFLPETDWGGDPNDAIDDTGLIEETPALHRAGNGAAGTLWVEGYPLKVTPQTRLLSEDGKDILIDQIHAGTWASFKGKWLTDHSIEVLSIKFLPNTITSDEVKFRDKSEPEIELPDYANHKPGKIKGHLKWTLNILPDQAIQDYVARVGEGLIPQYQKDLPASDPAKINFRFYVVEKPSRWKEVLNDASATPGGIIIVPDNVLAALDNEAQLAAILSNCIAITLDKQLFVHRARLKTQNIVGWASDFAGFYGLPVGIGDGIAAGKLAVQMNKRASRIGLRYMLSAGYDIRVAPFAWTVAANNKAHNPREAGLLPSGLTQSLMGDLYYDYASTDYSRLKTNREDYRKMLAELRAVAPKLPKPKNHPEPK
jgi:hypothetical protein